MPPLLLTAAILVITFVSSMLFTAAVRSYALRILLDIPNERSSHHAASQRGAGLAIAITFSESVALMQSLCVFITSITTALGGGVVVVAAIGWLDDHRHVPARWRVLVLFAVSTWTVYWLGGFPSINFGHTTMILGWVGDLLAVIGIVWMINLYNFMDGIDGLAAGEAVTDALVAAGLLWWAGAAELALVAAVLAAACGGFLWWNWPPAKIFMGDVGSGFLGYCFAVLMLASEKAHALPLTAWLILQTVSVLEATYT